MMIDLRPRLAMRILHALVVLAGPTLVAAQAHYPPGTGAEVPLACGMPAEITVLGLDWIDLTFEASAGDRVELRIGKDTPRWVPRGTVLAPSWTVVGQLGAGGVFNASLAETGVYRLRVQSNSFPRQEKMRVQLQWIFPILRSCAENIACGHFEAGSIQAGGFARYYRVLALPGDIVRMHLEDISHSSIKVFDSFGNIVVPTNHGEFSVALAGFYTVVAQDSPRQAGGNYRLFLDWIAPAERQCGQRMVCGEVASGDLTQGGGHAYYHFDAEAGDTVLLEALTDRPTNEWHVNGEVLRPDGSRIGPLGTPQLLDQSGSYTVVLSQVGRDRGPYRLSLNWLFPGEKVCGRKLECGRPIGGFTTAATPKDFFVFDASGGETLTLALEKGKTLEPSWLPVMSFYGPNGRMLGSTIRRLPLVQPGRYVAWIKDNSYGGNGSFTITADWTEASGTECAKVCDAPEPCESSGITFVDFDDVIFRSAALTTEVLAIGGRPIRGASADGVTRVLARSSAFSGPGTVQVSLGDDCGSSDPAAAGFLRNPLSGQTGSSLSVPLQYVTSVGKWFAFAIVETPRDFARSPLDYGALTRPVNVRFKAPANAGPTCQTDMIDLWRPPILAVHGLWADASAWKWRTLAARGTVNFFDYGATVARPVAENVRLMDRAVRETVEIFRGTGNPEREQRAAAQVDLVAHSLGSIVSRRYIANEDGDYRRADNFMQGDVHKLITLGGPHAGSPWATIVFEAGQVPVVGELLAELLLSQGYCVDCGAVADLRPEVLRGVPAAPVPTHTVYGTGATDYIVNAERFPNSVFSDEVPKVVDWLAWFYGLTAIDLSRLIFGDEPHDMLVSASSARGGLDDAQTSRARFIDGVHTYENKSWKLERLTWDAFNAPLPSNGSSSIFSEQLPAGPDYGLPTAARALANHSLPLPPSIRPGAVRLVLPDPLPPLHPGDPLTVGLEPVGDVRIHSARIVIGPTVQEIPAAPFLTTITLPNDLTMELSILALARLDSGEIAVSDRTVLPVVIPASVALEQLDITPSLLPVIADGSRVRLTVTGIYADGSRLNLSGSQTATTYMSDDPSVAEVSAEGEVEPRTAGQTTLRITNGLVLKDVPVMVISPAPDEPLARLRLSHTGPAHNVMFVVSPPDISGTAGGVDELQRWYPRGTHASVEIPPTVPGSCLANVTDNGLPVAGHAIVVDLAEDHAVLANYIRSRTVRIDVRGLQGVVTIRVDSPPDEPTYLTAPGQLEFCPTRPVTLVAPQEVAGVRFAYWQIGGRRIPVRNLLLEVSNVASVTAVYGRARRPVVGHGDEW